MRTVSLITLISGYYEDKYLNTALKNFVSINYPLIFQRIKEQEMVNNRFFFGSRSVPECLSDSVPSSELGPSTPSRKQVCLPPWTQGGEQHSLAVEGVGDPIRTTG